MVEELESILVGKLDDWILQRSNLLEHLVCNLGIEAYRAMLKLMEWRIECLIYADEFLLQSFQLALILQLRFLQGAQLILQFG